jgi:hypothetical protein
MKVFVDQTFFGEFASQVQAQAVLAQSEIALERVQFEARPNEARRLCAEHINVHYPEWKQLNLLRAGTKAQKDQMTAFIDACRTWSNADKPNPADLAAIQP